MKTLHKIMVTAALTLPMVVRAGILGVNNSGSPHDFSGASWNNNPADPATVCGVCHTPHHADPTAGPLWNHTPTTASGFTMYANPVNGVGGSPGASIQFTPATQPSASSLACLSCHDGTVAINSYGGGVQGGSAVTIASSANLTKDLTHSHPISFTYDATLVSKDKWLYPTTTTVLTPVSGTFVSGSDMSINGFLLNGNNTVECSSCHDVHNQEGTPFDITQNPHLVKINGVDAQGNGSLLCRSCHNK